MTDTITKLIIERQAPRDRGEKRRFDFVSSKNRLQQMGFKRHLYPDEAMRLCNNLFLERIAKEYVPAISDMITSNGEFFHTVAERVGEFMLLYNDPRIAVVERKYSIDQRQQFATCFPVGQLPSKTEVPLKDLRSIEHLIEQLWGAPYEQLSKEIRQNAYLVLPENELLPLARSNDSFTFGIIATPLSGSRGMKIDTQATVPRRSAYSVKRTQEIRELTYA